MSILDEFTARLQYTLAKTYHPPSIKVNDFVTWQENGNWRFGNVIKTCHANTQIRPEGGGWVSIPKANVRRDRREYDYCSTNDGWTYR